MIDTVRSWLSPAAPPRPVEDRRALIEQLDADRAEHAPAIARLDAAHEAARARVTDAERELGEAKRQAAAVERERWALSTAHDRRVTRLEARLHESAPPAIEMLRDAIRAVAAAARLLADTRISVGFEDVNGRHVPRVSTNTPEVGAVLVLAQDLDATLAAMLTAEAPDVEALGPFRELRLAEGGRYTRTVSVPVALADALDAAEGIPSTLPVLSPGAARQAAWDREESVKRRYPEPGTREWRPWR